MNAPNFNISSISSTKVVVVGVTSTIATALALKWLLTSRPRDDTLISSARSLLHNKFSDKKVADVEWDVVVIGSGMSGLTSAAVLSRLGDRVLVLEQHPDTAGGGTHSFDLKGYRFDSGLHYTVPWSQQIMALACLKKPKDVTPFRIMGEEDGCVDKIYLVPPSSAKSSSDSVTPFRMRYQEKHLDELYRQFPDERAALDKFMKLSDASMLYVKFFLFLRLFPKYIQSFCWSYLVPSWVTDSVSVTAKEILPQLTKNKRLISLLSSMWIDTGARPDRASFMMTAAVFRGVAMEGGCYPSGGAETMAAELIPVIEAHGGKVLIRANVKEIVVENGKVAGVRVGDNNLFIKCRDVVSSVGYTNTMQKLISPAVASEFRVSTSLPPSILPSAGFVMCNIGIAASAAALDVTNVNTWHIPVNEEGDAFPDMEAFFANPLGEKTRIPAFITFPSTKDEMWSQKHPNKTTCQMLVMADYDWFVAYKGCDNKNANDKERIDGYEALKDKWRDACLKIFLSYFPKAEGKIEVADISTPLTIEDYLRSPRGGAVGLDVTPPRFTDPVTRSLLDISTPIPGLFMTGQDCVIVGVTMAQIVGVITAIRMKGLFSAIKIVAQSIFLGNK